MKSRTVNRAAAALALALACVAAHAERADRNKPVHLEADQVNIDDARQINIFEGKVQLSQGTMLLRGEKMVVVQDKNGNMHGTATGQPASFRQKREGMDEYIEGFGQRIEYDTGTETVDFYGQARITRAQDEVRGDHITYNSRTEIFQVHGTPGAPADAAGDKDRSRVHVVIQPKAKAEGTDALPIKPTDELTPPAQPENKP